MNRKLSLAILISLSTLSAPAWSLGVGEARVSSALGAPLRATIPLSDVQGLSAQQLAVSLADGGGYRRAGLERSPLVDELALTVVPQPGGLAIRVRSEQPVREPYLDLLVDVDGPDGRQLRQVTLLFDPPGFGSQSAGAAAALPENPRQDDGPREASPQAVEPVAASTGREAGYVDVGETLWGVAQRLRPDADISMAQMMMALQDANPAAFPGGNINRLRAGHVLDVPSLAQITSRSPQEARRQVEAQHRAFSRGEPVSSMAASAPPATTPDAAPDAASVAGASPAESATEPEATSGTPRLTLLTDAQIEAEAAASASRDQGQRLDRLEARLEQSQLSLASVRAERDRTQAELSSLREELAGLRDRVATLATRQASAAKAAGEPAGDGLVERYLMPLWDMLRGLGRTLFGQLMAGGLVALLAVWLLVRRRRAAGDARQHDAAAEPPMPSALAKGDAGVEEGAAAPGVVRQEGFSPAAATSMPRTEVVSEADIFIAYGRFDQARALLEEGLDAEPDRHDLRLKLIRVLVEQGQWSAVHAEAQRLADDDDPGRQAELVRLLARERSVPTGPAPDHEPAASSMAPLETFEEKPSEIALAPVESTPAFRPAIEREPVAFDGHHRHARPTWQQGEDVSPEQISDALAELGLSRREAVDDEDDVSAEASHEEASAVSEQGGAAPGHGAQESTAAMAEEPSSGGSEASRTERANVIDYRPPPLEFDTPAAEETPMQPSVEFPQAQESPAIGEDMGSDLAALMRDAERPASAERAADEAGETEWDIEEVAFEPLHLDNDRPTDSPPVSRALVGAAEARLEQGDHAQARDLLDRALEEGDGEIREQAKRMIAQHNL